MSVPTTDAHASELRALRLLTATLAATTLAASIGTTLATGGADATAATAGYRVALVAAITAPLVAGAVARWAGVRMLRVLNAAAVVAFAALLLAFLLLELPTLGRPAPVPWFLTVTAVPVTAALVAWGRAGAWATLGGMSALLQAIRFVARSDAQDAVANDVFTFFAAASVVLLVGRFLRASRDFDRATLAASETAARQAEEEARSAASERLQLLVHDELLSTLSLAARVGPSLRAAVARQATRARRLLRELPAAPGMPSTVDSAAFATRVADAVAEEAPDTRLELDTDARRAVPLDAEAADALLGAVRQALANSAAHAGPGAHRTLSLRHDETGVRIVLGDDGVGFARDAVSPARMGIAASIEGRMRTLPGGDAVIDSLPGAGTTVTLAWRPASAGLRVEDADTAGAVLAGDDAVPSTVGYLVAVALLLLAQLGLAVLAAGRAGEPWQAGLALSGIVLGFVALGTPKHGIPTPRRTVLVAGCVLATAAVIVLPVERDATRYGDVWFIAALAFVLLVLAMRGRPRAAMIVAAGVAIVAVVSMAAQRNDPADVVAATTRMLAIVGIGAGFSIGTERVRSRTLALRRDELATVREASFTAAERRELRGRTAELERLIGGVLERLEGAEPLSPATRRECAMLEGRLRDGYRAGRLARQPLVDAAMAARGRGVDVALFDDPEERAFSEPELDAIATWLADRLDEIAEGRFTGRILPAGRRAAASAATDDIVAEFPLPHA